MKNDRRIVNNSNKSKSLVESVVYADEMTVWRDGSLRHATRSGEQGRVAHSPPYFAAILFK